LFSGNDVATIKYTHLVAVMMVQEPEPMEFEGLSSVYRVESKSQALSDVRKDLYHAMIKLREKAQKDHDAALANDPDSIMCEGLSERRKKVNSLSQKIVDLRMEKVIIMALRTSMGSSASLDKLTPEEREYYAHIVALSEKHRSMINKDGKNRKYVIPDISGGATDTTVQDAAVHASDIVTGEMNIEAGGVIAEIRSAVPDDDEELIVIRILEDLPPIAGPEFDYDLKKEDVVRMPAALANTLIKHEKAVLFRVTP
jgi:DNA replication factor GINS